MRDRSLPEYGTSDAGMNIGLYNGGRGAAETTPLDLKTANLSLSEITQS